MTSPKPAKRAAGREGCGCWAAVARGLRGACFRPAAPADGDGAGSAKGSHVHDAGGGFLSYYSLFFFFLLYISLFSVGWLVDGDRLFGLGKICSCLLVR